MILILRWVSSFNKLIKAPLVNLYMHTSILVFAFLNVFYRVWKLKESGKNRGEASIYSFILSNHYISLIFSLFVLSL